MKKSANKNSGESLTLAGKPSTMRKFLFYFVAVICISCNSSEEKKQVKKILAENEIFQYSGRYEQIEDGVALISSASSVKAKVFGDSTTVYLKSANDQHHYVSIVLNQGLLGRYRIKEDSLTFALPDTGNGATLTIFKDTEASNAAVVFQGISAEKIETVPSEDTPKIEFIGNSITCGMGADTREIGCEEGEWYDQHNAYLAYGPRVARALNAEFELSCVSGMGMYRNWNDENQPVMPNVYSNLYLNADDSKKADFTDKAPDVVSIALGTNDLSLGDGEKDRTDFDPEKFTSNYISFVESIYAYYPDTKIVLLSSPMIGRKENELLIASLNQVKDHFEKREISIFEFDKMEPGGCTSHPNLEDHEQMANALIPYFREILKK
ncbi:SGNH/GDSL hydrolase family protein [Salinimicrobium marinum]|nr:SGNH/GDSL hydrolase family protein [Salinimicrobium marinum]